MSPANPSFEMVVPDMPACCAYNLRNEMTPVIPTDEDVKIFLSTYLGMGACRKLLLQLGYRQKAGSLWGNYEN
jgi:hypothetical protein